MNPTDSNARDQALALAGVAQYALYAHRIAAEGDKRQGDIESALRAIFATNPESTDAVFGGPSGVADGIEYLGRQLDRNRAATDPSQAVIGRYLGQLLRLGSRLSKQPQAMNGIRSAIERARLAEAHRRTEILNQAYRDHVSGIKPQIMVQGHGQYLENTDYAECIRTLLLAGVRCAILWRQNGGAFWRLLLQRKRLIKALDQLHNQVRDAGSPTT